MDTRAQVHRFLAEEVFACDPAQLSYEEALGPRGLDSLSVIRLVAFLEETIGVYVPNEVLSSETLRNVDSIAQLAESLRQSS